MGQNTSEKTSISIRDKNACYVDGISVISDNGLVKVQWINALEGPTGFYNPRNPVDVNLLRFNIYFKDIASNAWRDPGNASRLALIPAKTEDYFLLHAAEFIASELQDHTTDGCHAVICERLSWLTPGRDEKNKEEIAAYTNIML